MLVLCLFMLILMLSLLYKVITIEQSMSISLSKNSHKMVSQGMKGTEKKRRK